MMTPIRTLIVDDEKPARRMLRRMIAEDRDCDVIGEAADGVEALDQVQHLAPQLVLLDVQMPGIDGLEMLARLPPAKRPHIILVTAHGHYGPQAFDLAAVDYIVKPFTDERLRLALARVKERLRTGQLANTEQALRALSAQVQALAAGTPQAYEQAKLVVRADGELHFLRQREIRWLEGQGDYLRIHLLGKPLLVRLSMKRAAELLHPTQFLRIHKSTIVNLAYVRKLATTMPNQQSVRLDDGTTLVIGPNYREALARIKDGAGVA
jgi:two-component system LytT family response regulator